MPRFNRLLITGAAGNLGRELRRGLAPLATTLRLTDRGDMAAAGAHEVLNRVQLFDSVAEAVADLNLVYATTARSRELVKPVVTPRASIATMRDAANRGERVGVLFGPEKAGLKNEDLHGKTAPPLTSTAWIAPDGTRTATAPEAEWRVVAFFLPQ